MSSVSRTIAKMKHSVDGTPESFALVYDELRALARGLMANERPNHTLGATALVHEAYLRLYKGRATSPNRAHFFSAAAEAMRRILVDHARHKKTQRNGGEFSRIELGDAALELHAGRADATDLLAIDETLTRLASIYPEHAELVKLLYFAGLNLDQAATVMGNSRSGIYRQWVFARAWMRLHMFDADAADAQVDPPDPPPSPNAQ